MADATQDIRNAIRDGFRDANTAVQRHTSEVIGTELEQFAGDIKKFTGSAFTVASTTAKAALGISDSAEDLDEDRNDMLENIEDSLKDPEPARGLFAKMAQMKEELVMAYTGQSKEIVKAQQEGVGFLEAIQNNLDEAAKSREREMDPKAKKSPWYKLLFAVGLIVGAIAGAILLPFTLLYNALIKIKPIAMVFEKIGAIIGRVRNIKFFNYLDDFVKFLGTKVPVLRGLVRGFKFGFKWLAWPLQIILSLIDFVRGFASTEGNIIDKIKAGLWSVIEGFIDLPVKLFGWIADWFLGIFGIQVEGGTAAKMMEYIKKGFNVLFSIFEGIWKIFDYLILQPLINFLKPTWDKVMAEFGPGIKMLGEGFRNAWEEIKPYVQEWLPRVIDIVKGFLGWLFYPIKRFAALVTEIADIVTSDDKTWGEKIKGIIGSVIRAFIDNILNIFSKLPFIGDKIEKLREELGVKPKTGAPADEKEQIDEQKRKEEARRKEEEDRKREEEIREQKRLANEAARANQMSATAIANTQPAPAGEKRQVQEIPDETDNAVLGLAMMGMS